MNQKGLILWTLAGSGVFLLYAAYKNQSPTGLLTKHLSGSTGPVAPLSGTSGSQSPASPPGAGQGYQDTPQQGGYQDWLNPFPNYLGGGPSAQNQVHRDASGVYYSTDPYGNQIAALPAYYQKAPNLYIVKGTVSA